MSATVEALALDRAYALARLGAAGTPPGRDEETADGCHAPRVPI